MESNKKSLYTIISILSLISVQVIMRSIGIDNISAHVYILLLSIACIMVIIGVYKNGTKGLGIKYNTIVAILMVIASISIGVSVTIVKCYPNIFNKYKDVLLGASLISFFALIIYIVICRIIYEKKF